MGKSRGQKHKRERITFSINQGYIKRGGETLLDFSPGTGGKGLKNQREGRGGKIRGGEGALLRNLNPPS